MASSTDIAWTGDSNQHVEDEGNFDDSRPWKRPNLSNKIFQDESSQGSSMVCQLYQGGCCSYDAACWNKQHEASLDSGYRLMLCSDFVTSGKCSDEQCQHAHGKAELRTPVEFEGKSGYKSHFCTYHLLEDLECDKEARECFDAHGQLDLRPSVLSLPPDLDGVDFTYCDGHVHLDEVLLARRYGSFWMHKRMLCKHSPCWSDTEYCAWAHGVADLRTPRLPFDKNDLLLLKQELTGLAGAEFGGCVHVSCEVATIQETIDLVSWGREVLGGRVYAAFGIHPAHFDDYTPEVEAQIEAALRKCGAQGVAWGECGLDYYRRRTVTDDGEIVDPDIRQRMCKVFAAQARAAVRCGVPLVVHSRDAEDDVMRVLAENVPTGHPVYRHFFEGSVETMMEFLERWPNGYVGFNGCVTYWQSDHFHNLASKAPLSRILLETDGPYMAPEPDTGASTHPGHIPWIAYAVAWAKEMKTADVLTATHENFRRFFQVDKCAQSS